MREIINECDQVEYESPIVLLKHPDKLKRSFQESANKALQLLQSQQYEESVLYLNKALDLLELGKDILKGISPYWRACLYGNFAFAYQKLWQIERCSKYCEKVQQELKRLFQEENRKQYRLNLTKELMKIKFERCALLSQLNKHELAIQICKGIFPLLEIFLVVVSGHIESKLKNDKTSRKKDNISFMEEVYEFSRKINQNLIKSLKEPLIEANKEPFYYWVKNPEKNEEQVIRKFVGTRENDKWKKSILGVTKSKGWINEFTISSVMHIHQYKLANFQAPSPIEEYVFKDKIYESILYCSLIHFTLATQMRFIQFEKQKSEMEEMTGKVGCIYKKYGYQDKSKQYLLSEAHHLKAINIVSNNVQFRIPYLAHIIRSYQKHYIVNKPLQIISSIAEESVMEEKALNRQKKQSKQLNSSKKKKSGQKPDKNKSISPQRLSKEKKLIMTKTDRNTNILNFKKNKKPTKSHSKSKKKSSSNDRRRSTEHMSAQKNQRKMHDSQVSFFQTYGKSSQKEIKFKSDSKISIRTRKKVLLSRIS